MTGMFQVGVAEYIVSGSVGSIPTMYSGMIEHAVLHDDFGVMGSEGTVLVITVGGSGSWPTLVISQRFAPGPGAGFLPGVFIVPETHILFVGAGTRLIAYDLQNVRRLWEDAADMGFWGWRRHGDIVLMSAELEFAAWDLSGTKKWSTFVEPPWEYTVRNSQVDLDIVGAKSSFDIETGPPRWQSGIAP